MKRSTTLVDVAHQVKRYLVPACMALVLIACNGEQHAPDSTSSSKPRASSAGTSTAPDGPLDLRDEVTRKMTAAERGARWMERFECGRCHEGTGLAKPPLEKRCVGCHQDIISGHFEAPDHALEVWRANIVHLRDVPNLNTTAALLRPSWVARFLTRPHDLRPGLEATMPRLAIDQDQARDIAAYLAQRMQQSDLGASSDLPQQAAQRTLTPQRLAQGRALFAANNCGACHAFEKPPAWRRLRPQASTPAERLAPDLRYTRDRMTRERIVAWLEGPRALLPNTLMPDPGLAVAQVELMTDYLLHAPRNDQHHPVPARLPPLDRPVSYAEVEDRILRKVCWHCHSQPDLARGDGGPGMSGGFGYPGRKLDLSTYGAVLGGYEERDGTPVSVFRAGPSGAAILLDVLLQRQREVAGESTSLLGMPLGLPPLPPEDIQLVESWIAQGRPQ